MPPRKVAAHGLRTGVMILAGGIDESATWLQACEHRRAYGEGVHAPPPPKVVRWSKWMPYHEAWTCESIGLHSKERRYAITIDIDHPDARHRLLGAIADGRLPTASWAVERVANGKAHAVWVLTEPYHTGPGAKIKPQQAAWVVFHYFCEVLGGDRRYLQLQTHNPVYRGSRASQYRPHMMSRRTYSLQELLSYVHDDWQPPPRPKRRTSQRGGSQALFIDGMEWAGHWANRGLPALAELHAINRSYPPRERVGDAQVEDLAERIEAEREEWATRPEGWHSEEFRTMQAARGRMGGLASGRSRRRELRPFDTQAAVLVYERGYTQAEAAAELGTYQQKVGRALKRWREIQAEGGAAVEGGRQTGNTHEANDPPQWATTGAFPGVSVSDRGRDSQDPEPLHTGGGAGGGRPRPDSPIAEAPRRRSDVRQPVDLGPDLPAPGHVDAPPPVVAAQIKVLTGIPDAELVGIPPRPAPAEPDPPVATVDLAALTAAHVRRSAQVEIVVSDAPPARTEGAPLLTLDDLRVIPGLNALRILAWAGETDGLAVGELTTRIKSGRERRSALTPLLERGLIRKLGKRPAWRYVATVRLPRLRDGETAEYVADPDTPWAYAAVMLGVALGAPVDTPTALARAIGLDRGTVRPHLAEARAFHRVLHELTGIEAAVAHAGDGDPIPTRAPPDQDLADDDAFAADLEALAAAVERKRRQEVIAQPDPGAARVRTAGGPQWFGHIDDAAERKPDPGPPPSDSSESGSLAGVHQTVPITPTTQGGRAWLAKNPIR